MKKRTHLVFLIHGIRTHASWQETAVRVLEEDAAVRAIPFSYGYFDLLRFLLPIPFIRDKPVKRLLSLIRTQRSLGADHVSIIAHSFGTYLFSKMLAGKNELKFHRVILCGGIIVNEFPWEDYTHKVAPERAGEWQLLNDCGMRDLLPVLAMSVTWGFGSSGRFGFGHSAVKSRFFNLGHSDFFSEGFVRKYWQSYISDGSIVGGELPKGTTPLWVSLLTVFKLRYFFLLVLLAPLLLALPPELGVASAFSSLTQAIKNFTAPPEPSENIFSDSVDFVQNPGRWLNMTNESYKSLGWSKAERGWSVSTEMDFGLSGKLLGRIYAEFENTEQGHEHSNPTRVVWVAQGDLVKGDSTSANNCTSANWRQLTEYAEKKRGKPSGEKFFIEGSTSTQPEFAAVRDSFFHLEKQVPLLAYCLQPFSKCTSIVEQGSPYSKESLEFRADGNTMHLQRSYINYVLRSSESPSRVAHVMRCQIAIHLARKAVN
jgi:pimeloyl-ACP methyl ester carboxylesterase